MVLKIQMQNCCQYFKNRAGVCKIKRNLKRTLNLKVPFEKEKTHVDYM